MREPDDPRRPARPAPQEASLFDPPPLEEGRRRRDEGTARAMAAAPEPWKEWARGAMATLAASGRPFCADDLEDLRIREGIPAPPSRAAVGGLFLAAANAGTITRTGLFQSMSSPQSHARRTELWRGVTVIEEPTP